MKQDEETYEDTEALEDIQFQTISVDQIIKNEAFAMACLERTCCGAERSVARDAYIRDKPPPRLSRKGTLRGVEQLTHPFETPGGLVSNVRVN